MNSVIAMTLLAGAAAGIPPLAAPAPQAVFVPSDAAPPIAVDPLASPAQGDSRARADRQLAERVATALAEDPALGGTSIAVSASAGHVVLGGSTLDASQATRAQALARAVAGVERVSSLLVTQPR